MSLSFIFRGSLHKSHDICAFRKECQLHLLINNTTRSPRKNTTCSSAQTLSVSACPVWVRRACHCPGHYLQNYIFFTSPVRSYVIPHEKVPSVTVSSSANYYLTTGIDFGAFAEGHERTKYGEWELYKKSEFVHGTEILATFLLVC
jgi:hypothetical protein